MCYRLINPTARANCQHPDDVSAGLQEVRIATIYLLLDICGNIFVFEGFPKVVPTL